MPEAIHAWVPVSSLQSDPCEKPLDQSAIFFDSAEPITTPLIPKHPGSGCFVDWFFGDVECFKRSDWITMAHDQGGGWFEGDRDRLQAIQAHVT